MDRANALLDSGLITRVCVAAGGNESSNLAFSRGGSQACQIEDPLGQCQLFAFAHFLPPHQKRNKTEQMDSSVATNSDHARGQDALDAVDSCLISLVDLTGFCTLKKGSYGITEYCCGTLVEGPCCSQIGRSSCTVRVVTFPRSEGKDPKFMNAISNFL